jgi:hypothetical protein
MRLKLPQSYLCHEHGQWPMSQTADTMSAVHEGCVQQILQILPGQITAVFRGLNDMDRMRLRPMGYVGNYLSTTTAWGFTIHHLLFPKSKMAAGY